jgi:hypothetical protein
LRVTKGDRLLAEAFRPGLYTQTFGAGLGDAAAARTAAARCAAAATATVVIVTTGYGNRERHHCGQHNSNPKAFVLNHDFPILDSTCHRYGGTPIFRLKHQRIVVGKHFQQDRRISSEPRE